MQPHYSTTCHTCRKLFYPRPQAVKKGWGIYCSKSCARLHPSKKLPAEVRFWKFVDKTTDPNICWMWHGPKDRKGYGQFNTWDNRKIKHNIAHRIAWILTNGPITDNLFVLHHCDHPACCNPTHLFLGTAADNIHDMWNKNRASPPPHSRQDSEYNNNAKLTGSIVRQIRKRHTKDGVSFSHLSRELGLSRKAISNAIQGVTWSDITD